MRIQRFNETRWLFVFFVGVIGYAFDANGDDKRLTELQDAIGDAGFAMAIDSSVYENDELRQTRYVLVQINAQTDDVLKSLASTSQSARGLVEHLSVREPCRNPDSLQLMDNFPSLSVLNICEDGWSIALSKAVSKSTSITTIWGKGSGIDGTDLQLICCAKQIECLMIGSNELLGDEIQCLGNLKRLRQLSLNDMKIESDDLRFVRQLKDLRWLILLNTHVDDSAIPVISACKELLILNLAGTECTEEAARKLPGVAVILIPKSNGERKGV